MPAACQNGAEDIEEHPGGEPTGSDQESSRLTRCVKRPSKQWVMGRGGQLETFWCQDDLDGRFALAIEVVPAVSGPFCRLQAGKYLSALAGNSVVACIRLDGVSW